MSNPTELPKNKLVFNCCSRTTKKYSIYMRCLVAACSIFDPHGMRISLCLELQQYYIFFFSFNFFEWLIDEVLAKSSFCMSPKDILAPGDIWRYVSKANEMVCNSVFSDVGIHKVLRAFGSHLATWVSCISNCPTDCWPFQLIPFHYHGLAT